MAYWFYLHTFAALISGTDMAGQREFDIAFVGLKPGVHEYSFEISDQFFLQYADQDFKNCSTTVRLQLDKKTGFILLKFDIDGKVDVVCDRCGNMLPLQLWDEFNLVVKLVDNAEEMNNQEDDPDVYYLNRTESHLHISNWIYEFVILSLPMTKMCSEEKIGGPYCNMEVIEKLRKMQPEDHNASALWKGLEKFKENKKKKEK